MLKTNGLIVLLNGLLYNLFTAFFWLIFHFQCKHVTHKRLKIKKDDFGF